MATNESGLFKILEGILRDATEPVTCNELYDMPAVRKHAASANRVSDYLGNLWRKGLLTRLPAPRTDRSSARWMYQWKGRTEPIHAVAYEPIEYKPKGMLYSKPTMEITEEGGVITIELTSMTITIRPKQ